MRRARARLAGVVSAALLASAGAPFAPPVLAEEAVTAPVPRLNPRRAADDPIASLIQGETPAPAAAAAPPAPETLGTVGFKVAVELLRKGDPAGATLAAYALPDRVSADVVDWLVATSGDENVPSDRIVAVAAKLGDWPGQSLMQLRLEQALDREEASDAEILRQLAGRAPETNDATLAVGRALIAAGRRDEARTLAMKTWRRTVLDEDTEKDFLKVFGPVLTKADHKGRMDLLLYNDEATAGLRTAKFLDANQQKLADAMAAVARNRANAKKLLDALPAAVRNDPLAQFGQIKLLQRADRAREAADLLAKAPKDQAALVDPDEWWIERRIVSRTLVERGDARRAYEVAANHSARSAHYKAEAEFHAGWYALEYLRDPAVATRHFEEIERIASLPLSLSRAEYWLARAARAAGDKDKTTYHFKRASAFTTTFYGQLALAELGVTHLPLATAPKPTAETVARFRDRRFVQVVNRLIEANYADRAGTFVRALAYEISDPGEIRLLAELAQAADQHQLSLQIGIIAAGRDLPVDDLAFSTAAIPPSVNTRGVEQALVYAIARQESKFNHEAISSAGARGLLQLMPATAKETARSLGLRYSRDRLTSDPAYNATLGAAYLGKMLERFGGSYVMTFAAYNAGGSRVDEWVKRFGDPRDPKVDVVNWIESIPFTETRNYVQRIMENLQVYRARLGDREIAIREDLHRPG